MQKDAFNGNDIYFVSPNGERTNSVADATRYTRRAVTGVTWLSEIDALNLAKRTVRYDVVLGLKRKAWRGLKMPKSVSNQRAKQRRGSSGKYQFNCPDCGRIVWLYHGDQPFDCTNKQCKSHDTY
ncbi:MAG: hypothetical protein ACN2B6_00280 [Rickettsiales bacterium]